MLKKILGIEAIEREWPGNDELKDRFKVSSTLIIPEGCERIGDYAFWRYEKIKKVVIPESVMEIGASAFRNCINLEEVKIPKSVSEIGEWAFIDCRKATIILKKPKSEFYIYSGAFEGCKDVKEEIRD